jgi:UDP-N-acetylglucosamine 2-epimerase (non-hydrolysing)
MKKQKYCFIYGTRPEIIKISPLIKLCQKKKISFICIHTGQHYSYKLDGAFLKTLDLPKPNYRLNIRSKAPHLQGDHTGRMLIKIEEVLIKELPTHVFILGDTNTALAGLLTAEKITTTKSFTGFDIKTVHVEAGLRCFDRRLPEETNRIIIDHFADYLFVPTGVEKKYLRNEGIPQSKIFITGNIIVDVLKNVAPVIKKKSSVIKKLNIDPNEYLLLTLHRQENVNSKKVLSDIFKGIALIGKKVNKPIIFPVHPRTENLIKKYRIKIPKNIVKIGPMEYLDFLWLQKNAVLVMTDSGGVQEEACTLRVPCITLRDSTERPQTVSLKANIVTGTNPDKIAKSALVMIKSKRKWKNPYGQGDAASKMLNLIQKKRNK